MAFTQTDLTKLIQESAKEWLYADEPICYIDINSGSCGEFALHVEERLPSDAKVILSSTATYMRETDSIYFQSRNNEYTDIKFSNHMWITFEGRHFDIERPRGVENFIDLPFFQREIEIQRTGVSESILAKAIIDDPRMVNKKLRYSNK